MEKVSAIRHELERLFPESAVEDIMLMLGRCAHYYFGNRKHLSERETVLYDFLRERGLNPNRVYRWFRLSIVPEDVRLRIQNGTLTERQALRLATNRRRQRDLSLRWRFMETARQAVREALAE